MTDRMNGKAKLLPLSKRNAETANMAIRELNEKVHAGLEAIVQQQGTLQMLIERVGKLETALQLKKMNLTGLGPTIK